LTYKERILEYIHQAQTSISTDNFKNISDIGITAEKIADVFKIARPNASSLLNDLVRDKDLVKISTRPVYYISKDMIEKVLDARLTQNIYDEESFHKLFDKVDKKNTDLVNRENIFGELIGYDGSLKTQLEQIKAAALYPPNGLHTLILGPPGSGKSFLVELIYKFSEASALHRKFNTLNCADYYNNPQLLLSYLFGYAKGAYTGAESDKQGLVELTDGGILFLDEVHRLPPEGQEMLFYIIDKGQFHRLGDPVIRKANLMIIAATTEDPDSTLLKTFMRRIPIIVKMPSLEERPMKEKMEIIKKLLLQEAMRVKLKIQLFPEALKALLFHRFDGNVGELKSILQMMCAKAFARNLYAKQEEIRLDVGILPDYIKNELSPEIAERFSDYYLENIDEPLLISNENSFESMEGKYDFYDLIIEKMNLLNSQGLSEEEIDKNISVFINSYFKKVIGKFKRLSLRELEKIVDAVIINFANDMKEFSQSRLNIVLPESFIYTISLHFQSLLERVKRNSPIINARLDEIKNRYGEQYVVAKEILDKFKKRFKVDIPDDEAGFITVFLTSEFDKKEDATVGIVVITHGEKAASSMGEVVNKLLNINKVRAIDMPLSMSIDAALSKVISVAKEIDEGKGVLFLVDMGSLKTFGDTVTKLTGINSATLDRVNTPLILECARRAYFLNYDLDSIVNFIMQDEVKKNNAPTKKQVILTVCSTGKGAAFKLEEYLINNFPELKDYEIMPFDILEIRQKSNSFVDVMSSNNVVCTVGTVDPKLTSVPFVPVDKVFKDRDYVLKLLKRDKANVKTNIMTEQSQEKHCELLTILEEILIYVNPRKAHKAYIAFVDKLEKELNATFDEDFVLKFGIHFGAVIERVLTKNCIVHDNKDEVIDQNQELFEKIRICMKTIEDSFDVKVNDDEICYCIDILNETGLLD